MQVRERFNPAPLGVNGSYTIKGLYSAGFLATVSGTLTITGVAGDGTTAVTFVNALPVTAGLFVRIPILFPNPGAVVTLAGGAAGTLFL